MCLVHALRLKHALEGRRNHGKQRADHAHIGNGTGQRERLCAVILVFGHQRGDAPQRDVADRVGHAPKDIGERSPGDDERALGSGLFDKAEFALEFLQNRFGKRVVGHRRFVGVGIDHDLGLDDVAVYVHQRFAVCVLLQLPGAAGRNKQIICAVKFQLLDKVAVHEFDIGRRILQRHLVQLVRFGIHAVEERQNRRDQNHAGHKQKIGLAFAPFGAGLVDDGTHHRVVDRVPHTRQRENQRAGDRRQEDDALEIERQTGGGDIIDNVLSGQTCQIAGQLTLGIGERRFLTHLKALFSNDFCVSFTQSILYRIKIESSNTRFLVIIV